MFHWCIGENHCGLNGRDARVGAPHPMEVELEIMLHDLVPEVSTEPHGFLHCFRHFGMNWPPSGAAVVKPMRSVWLLPP